MFVYLSGSRPRRKVAVAINDAMSWNDFIAIVERKLRIGTGGTSTSASNGIASIRYGSSGAEVRSLSQLQDIDELEVMQRGEEPEAGAGINGDGRTNRSVVENKQQQDSRIEIVDRSIDKGSPSKATDENGKDEEEDKYGRRRGVAGFFSKIMRSSSSPSRKISSSPLLPMSTSADNSSGTMKSKKRSRRCCQGGGLYLKTQARLHTYVYFYLK